jgi:hypothetical protein
MKSGNLRFLKPSGPLQGCNGIALKYLFIYSCANNNNKFSLNFRADSRQLTAHISYKKNYILQHKTRCYKMFRNLRHFYIKVCPMKCGSRLYSRKHVSALVSYPRLTHISHEYFFEKYSTLNHWWLFGVGLTLFWGQSYGRYLWYTRPAIYSATVTLAAHKLVSKHHVRSGKGNSLFRRRSCYFRRTTWSISQFQ